MIDLNIKNLPASVHGRLLTLAQKRGRPFKELRRYCAVLSFLYPLSQSKYAQKFVLKSALLFPAWSLTQYRPRRHMDLLGDIGNEWKSYRSSNVCSNLLFIPTWPEMTK